MFSGLLFAGFSGAGFEDQAACHRLSLFRFLKDAMNFSILRKVGYRMDFATETITRQTMPQLFPCDNLFLTNINQSYKYDIKDKAGLTEDARGAAACGLDKSKALLY